MKGREGEMREGMVSVIARVPAIGTSRCSLNTARDKQTCTTQVGT